MYTTMEKQIQGSSAYGSRKVNQLLYIPQHVQILLGQISDTLGKPKSQIVSELIEQYADDIGREALASESKKTVKAPLSRFDVVRSTLLPKLYALAGENTFEYRHFCRLMSEPPISIGRDCVVRDYLMRMIFLGYIYPYIDEDGEGVKKELSLDTKFLLSGEIVATEGKLEGLQ